MKFLKLTLFLVLALSLVICEVAAHEKKSEEVEEEKSRGMTGKLKDTVLGATDNLKEKIKGRLNLDEKTMPPEAGETAKDARSGLEHAEKAVKEGIEAVKSEGFTDTIRHAYDAVKEAIRSVTSGKDAVVDSQKTELEGAKDAGKETIKVHSKHEKLREKLDDGLEFIKEEYKESKEKVKEGLEGDREEGKESTFTDKIVEKITLVGHKISSAIHKSDSSDRSDHADDKKKQAEKNDKKVKEGLEGEREEGKESTFTDRIVEKISSVFHKNDNSDRSDHADDKEKQAKNNDKKVKERSEGEHEEGKESTFTDKIVEKISLIGHKISSIIHKSDSSDSSDHDNNKEKHSKNHDKSEKEL